MIYEINLNSIVETISLSVLLYYNLPKVLYKASTCFQIKKKKLCKQTMGGRYSVLMFITRHME